ncbi:hypothetical protein EDD86DRAFT_201745 [Gorgonomyces haynaldii]|nr:hypothetical protein EDD86DRAFT_201745 [Gorgonomyces haynaldii]
MNKDIHITATHPLLQEQVEKDLKLLKGLGIKTPLQLVEEQIAISEYTRNRILYEAALESSMYYLEKREIVRHATILDPLLQLSGTQVYEFAGPPASGKTQLCLWIASQIKGRTLYLSTHGFPVKRFLDFTENLDLLDYRNTFYAEQVLESLESADASYGLVIVDSIAAILAPLTGLPQGYQLMEKIACKLRWIARHLLIPVIVVNYTAGSNNELIPALGQQWHAIPTQHLFFNIKNRYRHQEHGDLGKPLTITYQDKQLTLYIQSNRVTL